MNEIILKQLSAVPKFENIQRISYYEEKPGNQVHMDTMFWAPSGISGAKLVPILVIVDVATKFAGYYVQETKNEKVLEHFNTFKAALTERFPETNPDTLLVTDGAKELAKPFRNHPHVRQKVSTGMNKAVLAESKIAQLRKKLRAIELGINVKNVQDDTEIRITKDVLEVILPELTIDINSKAKQMPPPETTSDPLPTLKPGTPVFLINLHKFFPYQLKDILRKKSYDQNYYYEPFIIGSSTTFNNITKYHLLDTIGINPLNYTFYRDQLQPIDSRYAAEYIKKWQEYHKKRTGVGFF